MPEVLDFPQVTAPFKDPEVARQAGLRSAEVARQKAQELENLRTLLSTKPIEPKPEPVPVAHEVQRQLDLTNEQIARVRERLNDDNFAFCEHCQRSGMDDKSRAGLLRELRGLMEHLCRLHNIPQAPTTKATPAKQSRRSDPMPEPTVPQAVVVSPTPEQGKLSQMDKVGS